MRNERQAYFALVATREETLTPTQLAWAKEHDWFLASVNNNGRIGVQVVERFTEGPDEYHEFYNIRELKAWAGY